MFPFLYRLSFFEAKKFASYGRIFERWIYPKKYLLEMRRIITLEICGIYRKAVSTAINATYGEHRIKWHFRASACRSLVWFVALLDLSLRPRQQGLVTLCDRATSAGLDLQFA